MESKSFLAVFGAGCRAASENSLPCGKRFSLLYCASSIHRRQMALPCYDFALHSGPKIDILFRKGKWKLITVSGAEVASECM